MKGNLFALSLLTGIVWVLLAGGSAWGATERQEAAQQECQEAPGRGYEQTISGMVDGDVMQITVSDRFGGAVSSLTWRGVEFINIWDHGRQISYAWSMDGYGECLNPTEPGSARDYQAPTSTSELLRVCKEAENTMTTTTQPAFWLAPGESGFCEGGATNAVNESPQSDQILQKTMTIGHEGIDNVIVFDAEISNPSDYTFMRAEVPTGYLTSAFSSYWLYNPQSGELSRPESGELAPPWSFVHAGPIPTILATEDGAHAMGAYFPGPDQPGYYGIYRADSANPDEETNKWHMVIEESPYPAGTYRYRTFAVVGTLETVQEAMRALYELYPLDFRPPEGYVDLADCSQIAGWAWDPDLPDEAIEVALVEVVENGEEIALATLEASVFREDLVTALGDNGRHGFWMETPAALRDGEQHTIRLYGLNPQQGAGDAALIPETSVMRCAAVQATATTEVPTAAATELATEEAVAQVTEEATVVATGTATAEATAAVEEVAETEDGDAQPLCGLAIVLGAVGVVLGRRRRGLGGGVGD